MTPPPADKKQKGLVFNIQKYSVHDGPGIRTIVFLKGCPLRCLWCSNPESQSFRIELAFNEGRCLGFSQCQRCLKACPHGAVDDSGPKPLFKRDACVGCERFCVAACPASGVIAYGQERSVEDVLRVVEQDALFYSRSGGGMTLSGGEPLAQPTFALALLREAKRRRINTAVETCGHVPWETLESACGLVDTLLFDIKNMDTQRHRIFTGVGNELILDNFRKLTEAFPGLPVHVRTPVIPGFNDTVEDILAIRRFLEGRPQVSYEVLRYHRLGTQKYVFLGREAPMGDQTLSDERFAAVEAAAKADLNAACA
ncbi:MAG: glycyl-radical enzyme activating protein [Desulfovibrionaceae bacterium]